MSILWIQRGTDPQKGFRLSQLLNSQEILSDLSQAKGISSDKKLFIDCDEDAFLTIDPDFRSSDSRNPGSLEFTDLDFFTKFVKDKQTLFPMIALDPDHKELMVAWGNLDSLKIALEKGLGTYYSRSRKEQWTKGETSGHSQKILYWEYVKDPFYIIYHVAQAGAACHTGYYTCFFREELFNGEKRVVLPSKVAKES